MYREGLKMWGKQPGGSKVTQGKYLDNHVYNQVLEKKIDFNEMG
jgi:hypothetical protein